MTEHDLDYDPELDGGGLEESHDPDDCGPPVHRDCVDDCLERIIEMLEHAGYDEAVADQAMHEAMAMLIETSTLPDTPDLDQPETAKVAWIANAEALIRGKLREMGLEFPEE